MTDAGVRLTQAGREKIFRDFILETDADPDRRPGACLPAIRISATFDDELIAQLAVEVGRTVRREFVWRCSCGAPRARVAYEFIGATRAAGAGAHRYPWRFEVVAIPIADIPPGARVHEWAWDRRTSKRSRNRPRR